MNDFFTAAEQGNTAAIKKSLKGRSDAEKWLAAQGAYKNGHLPLVKIILGKDSGEEAITEFKSRDFIEVAKKGDYNAVIEWLNDPEVDPAAYENSALRGAYRAGHLKIVYELMELATVREQLFADCKENLTLEETKFLLFEFQEKIEDSKFLYEQYLDEEVDDDFGGSEGSESDEDSFNGSSSDEDEGEASDEDELPEPSFSVPKGKRVVKAVERKMNYDSDDDEEEEEKSNSKINTLNQQMIKLYKKGITNSDFPQIQRIVNELANNIPKDVEQKVIKMMKASEYADMIKSDQEIKNGLKKMLKLVSFNNGTLLGEIRFIFTPFGVNWNKLAINDSDFREFLAENMGLI